MSILLFFTLISNKVRYIMTPEVLVTTPRPGRIGYDLYAQGVYRNGEITFLLDLTKDSYLDLGDTVKLNFVNLREQWQADVISKTFDEEQQMVSVTAAMEAGDASVYDGQLAEVSFYYLCGSYQQVLPRSAVHNEGGGTFVYVVKSAGGVFGERPVVARRDVTVLDADEFNCAVESLNNDDMVVYAFTKPLRNEAEVRLVP